MTSLKLLSILLCITILVSCFAGCDNTDNGDESTINNSQGEVINNDDLIDEETGEIINIGSPETMKITPDEIGTLSNPVIRGLEAYPSEKNIKWKEEAYGMVYDYDTCDGDQRQAKLISAYVAGDSYDVFPMLSGDFPVFAQKGIVHPLEKIMPVYDENYFNQTISQYYTWKGRCYATSAVIGLDEFGSTDVNPYGILYNKTLFDNAGVTDPMTYYENGNWTWATFKNIIKQMTNIEGGADDYYGLTLNDSYIVQSSLATNGTSIIEQTTEGVELNFDDPKVTEALNFANEVRALSSTDAWKCLEYGQQGKTAMYTERPHQLNHLRNASPQYEYGWVPFPTPDGSAGTLSSLAGGWSICKGAKNIQGAMAWITCEAYKETYFKETDYLDRFSDPDAVPELRTAEEIKFQDQFSRTAVITGLEGYGLSAYNMIEDAKGMGMAAAVEKHTPQFQAKLDEIMGTATESGAIDFEDQGVFDFDSKDSDYPFVNVLGDDKITYGDEGVTSLNIDLSGMTDFGAILHTKPELFKLQYGGQYKVTFKLYVDAELDNETLALAAKTTDNLNGDAVAMNWIENIKVGETTEVEAFFNINSAFTGDLAIVLMGSATDANPDLKVIIDDFRVELVTG